MTTLERVRRALSEVRDAYNELAGQGGIRSANACAHLKGAEENLQKAEGFLLAAASGHMRAVKKPEDVLLKKVSMLLSEMPARCKECRSVLRKSEIESMPKSGFFVGMCEICRR